MAWAPTAWYPVNWLQMSWHGLQLTFLSWHRVKRDLYQISTCTMLCYMRDRVMYSVWLQLEEGWWIVLINSGNCCPLCAVLCGRSVAQSLHQCWPHEGYIPIRLHTIDVIDVQHAVTTTTPRCCMANGPRIWVYILHNQCRYRDLQEHIKFPNFLLARFRYLRSPTCKLLLRSPM